MLSLVTSRPGSGERRKQKHLCNGIQILEGILEKRAGASLKTVVKNGENGGRHL